MYRFLYGISVLLLLQACSIVILDPEDYLKLSGIDEQTFRVADACRQVEIYALVGGRYLDREHATVSIPDWVDDEINEMDEQQLLTCLVSEGERQLQISLNTLSQRKAVSLSIHALLYKVFDLNLHNEPEVVSFAKKAMCERNILYRSTLAYRVYSYSVGLDWRSTPDEVLESFCG